MKKLYTLLFCISYVAIYAHPTLIEVATQFRNHLLPIAQKNVTPMYMNGFTHFINYIKPALEDEIDWHHHENIGNTDHENKIRNELAHITTQYGKYNPFAIYLDHLHPSLSFIPKAELLLLQAPSMINLWQKYAEFQNKAFHNTVQDIHALIITTVVSDETHKNRLENLKNIYHTLQPITYNGHVISSTLEEKFGIQIMQGKNNLAYLYPLWIKELYNTLSNEK